MSEQRLVDIEVKLAHHEQAVLELNDVITEQQAKLMQLDALCNQLIEKLRAIDQGATDAPHDEPPPHY